MARKTKKYHLKTGNLINHTGITDDLEEREKQHQRVLPDSHIVQVGRSVQRDSALDWERKQREAGKPTEGYRTTRTPMKRRRQ